MSIHRLTIFLLLADFILIGSGELPASNISLIDANADGVNRPNGESDLLPKFNNSGASIETQKLRTLLSHQETTSHRYKETEGMSSGRLDYLIAALSKIAKVRSFEEDPASIGRSLIANVYNAARKESSYLQNGVSAKNIEAPALLDTKLSSKLSSNGISDNPSSNGTGREHFHCRAIRHVYILDIKENVPSYACTSGGKMFILSSKRFFQDRRSSLHVNIDDHTLRKLNNPVVILAKNRSNVIPAILILIPGNENYDIRNQQSVILREQQTVDDKNIE